MNIAVFGWYHHRNAGDDRIQACLTRWLDGHTLAFLPAGRPAPVGLLRTYDAAIIGGGGLLMNEGGIFRRMAGWVRSAGIPVALVGVSVERLTPGLRSELREFLDVCCFAWFRDQGSLDEVGAHPRAFVAPDVTWLYPYPVSPPRSDAVALALARPVRVPTDAWRDVMARLGKPVLPWPLHFEGGGDGKVLSEVLPGAVVPSEFTLEPLLQSDVAVSARYHGLLFAIQTGRPFVAVGGLPKTRRFLTDVGLGEWTIDESEPGALPDRLRHLERVGEAHSLRLLSLRDELRAETEKASRVALDKLLEAASSLPRPSRRWRTRLRSAIERW